MSSNYHVICLSHDPAIVLGGERNDWDDNTVSSLVAEARPAHPNCDLVVGRWSGALIEVTCPGRSAHPGAGYHILDETIKADWLRLLIKYGEVERLCWPLARSHRLRDELDVPEPPSLPTSSDRDMNAAAFGWGIQMITKIHLQHTNFDGGGPTSSTFADCPDPECRAAANVLIPKPPTTITVYGVPSTVEFARTQAEIQHAMLHADDGEFENCLRGTCVNARAALAQALKIN